MDKSFENGCVLIIGGSGGIGSLCAQEFSNSGAKVAITYYKNEQAAIKIANEIDLEPKWIYPNPDSVMEARIKFVCNL